MLVHGLRKREIKVIIFFSISCAQATGITGLFSEALNNVGPATPPTNDVK